MKKARELAKKIFFNIIIKEVKKKMFLANVFFENICKVEIHFNIKTGKTDIYVENEDNELMWTTKNDNIFFKHERWKN